MRNLKKDIDRNILLDQLRKAVTLQIELWDVRLALSETLERALTDVQAQRPMMLKPLLKMRPFPIKVPRALPS